MTIFILTLSSLQAFSQSNYTKRSLDWKYDLNREYIVHNRIAKDDSVYHIYFSINIPEGIDFEENVGLDYEIKASLDTEEVLFTRTVNYPVHGIGRDTESTYFHIRIPDANNHNVLFLNVSNKVSGKEYTYDIQLISKTKFPSPDFMVFNNSSLLPVCADYVSLPETLSIRSFNDEDEEFFIYYYETDFEVADPPMFRIKKTVSKSLDISSLTVIKGNESFALEEEGLYFIQSDTSSLSGIGIRVVSEFYPKMTALKELSEPLVYLSTKDEIEELINEEDVRAAFESFWLDLAKSESVARMIIKRYYDRIEEANIRFTNYKEGWKTDMGMIFIIVGSPDEVYLTDEKESWYYKNPGKNQIVVFNFLKIRNIFSDKHYTLIRDSQYKSFWYKSIDAWRKGIN
jgi:GWxTD domain-containing protein